MNVYQLTDIVPYLTDNFILFLKNIKHFAAKYLTRYSLEYTSANVTMAHDIVHNKIAYIFP